MGVGIFTWWGSTTFGTWLFTRANGAEAGSDSLGNVYYTGKGGRRWVIYAGETDPSRLPPEWYAWLSRMTNHTPDELPPPKPWMRPPVGNTTGTRDAYRPSGALEAGGVRSAATGDYEAWSPDA